MHNFLLQQGIVNKALKLNLCLICTEGLDVLEGEWEKRRGQSSQDFNILEIYFPHLHKNTYVSQMNKKNV